MNAIFFDKKYYFATGINIYSLKRKYKMEKQFEIEFKMGEKTIEHKIISSKNIPKMYLDIAKEFIKIAKTIWKLYIND